MNDSQLRAFRNTLEGKRIELEPANRSRDALAIETSSDELDRIQNAGEREYAMRTMERTSSRLREVRDALRRIDAGTFGVCEGCEDLINLKRLAAVPWAAYCIACQEAADLREKRPEDELDVHSSIAA